MTAPTLPDVGSRAERLARARSALTSAAARVQPRGEPARHTSAVRDAGTLPVADELAGLFPGAALRRGSTVAVHSSRSLLLALMAEASAGGHWSAVVGLPDLGMVAVAEAGLDLARTAVIGDPGDQLVGVVAALLDGVEMVAVAGTQRLRAGDRQRLAARSRERGAVLLACGGWPGADVELRVTEVRWIGAAADGQGRLRACEARVQASGRGSSQRRRSARVQLPGPDGRIAPATRQAELGITAWTPVARCTG